MFCNKFQSVEEPKSRSSKKYQWVGEPKSQSKSFNKNLPISQFQDLEISDFDFDDDDEKYKDIVFVEVDHISDDEDPVDDGELYAVGGEDRCEICRKKSFKCKHYDYDKKWKNYRLIKCFNCEAVGQHWTRDCPCPMDARPLREIDLEVHEAMMKLFASERPHKQWILSTNPGRS